MAHDIQAIYSILLAKGYQEQLFSDLGGTPKREKGGRETLVQCPFCQKEHHFSYNRDKPVWRCWHCGEAGDWIEYLKKARELDFRDAIAELASAAGVTVSPYDQARHREYTKKANVLETALDFFTDALKQDTGKPVKEYLQDRGYSDADIEGMQVGAYLSRSALQKHLKKSGFSDSEIRKSGLLTTGFGETHTLIIPWEDAAGRAVGIVGRTPLPSDQISARGIPKYKYSAGLAKSEGLIGFSSVRGCETIILAEGVIDARYLNSKGLKIVSVGGKDLSLAQIRLLELSDVREVLLSLDMDAAGRAATAKAADMLSRSTIRPYVVDLPSGFKDPDEFVRAHGVKVFEQVLAKAERWPRWNARYICQSHDLSTDRGLDSAIQEAGNARAKLDDPLDQRFLLDGLKSATGLGEEELQCKLLQQDQRVAARRAKNAVQSIITKVQKATSEDNQRAAEQELERGVHELHALRGAELPEPYLLGDFERDIQQTPDGLKTGYSQLDDILRIPRGALSILAGRPGHGKTTLQLNLVINFVKQYPNQRFYLFSYEEARIWLALKIVMILAGEVLDSEHNQAAYLRYLRSKRSQIRAVPAIEAALSQYAEFTASGRLTIVDRRLGAEDLASTIARLSGQPNVGGIVIDYIQKIPLGQALAVQRYQEVKRISELLLEQAVSHGLPILLGAQLGRSSGTTGKARVRLDNLRESGDIEQDASLVLGIYNSSADKTEDDGQEDLNPEADLSITVLKNRGGVQGRHANLALQKSTLRIQEHEKRSTGSARAKW